MEETLELVKAMVPDETILSYVDSLTFSYCTPDEFTVVMVISSNLPYIKALSDRYIELIDLMNKKNQEQQMYGGYGFVLELASSLGFEKLLGHKELGLSEMLDADSGIGLDVGLKLFADKPLIKFCKGYVTKQIEKMA